MKNKRRTVWAVSPKAPVLFMALLLVPCFTAFSQDAAQQAAKKFAVGLGLELNNTSLDNAGFGIAVGADYNLPIEAAPFATGLNVGIHLYPDGFALEPAVMFRWYFLPGKPRFHEETEGSTFKGHYGPYYHGLFVQADVGVTVIVEGGESAALFLGGLRAGYRLPLKFGLYVEPFARFGYPFMFGFGALAGINF